MSYCKGSVYLKLTIIGAGPGGYEAAVYAAKQGVEVTLIEQHKVGGTCLNIGCIPTKSLLAASDLLQDIRDAKSFGIETGPVTADYAAVVARKNKIVDVLVRGVEQTLKANGVTLLSGKGSLAGGGAVVVTDADGGKQTVQADNILLATGSRPAWPGFLPPKGPALLSSDELLSAAEMPGSVLVLGGGVIGCELGQFLARMGSAVTIVEMMPHLLPLEDEDTAKALERQFRRDKIKTVCGHGVTAVETGGKGVRATLDNGTVLEADVMLVAIGRRPYTEGLGLENAGIVPDERGFVPVDTAMRTTASNIYAAGDIVATPQLAHLAAKEGFVAVDNILGKTKSVNYTAVPRCVYTEPEVASVGVTERELSAAGKAYRAGRFDFIANGKAKAIGKTQGFCKVLTDERDIVVGAAVTGAHATDMLAVLTLAVTEGLSASALGDAIYPHPTMSEGIMEALHDVHGMSIHKG